ncbi:MAG: ribbon-helix-helix protein, CopG family [Gammaproteobacteria bacterium]
MHAQKLSISLPESSADFIEQYRRTHSIKSRSEVIEQALQLLRQRELERAYRDAAAEESDFKDLDNAIMDGLDDETW